MGATADITKQNEVFVDGKDSVVIRRIGGSITGGRTLDLTGFPEDSVRAGHVIIRETASGTCKPLGVSSGEFGELPAGHEYVGVLIASVTKGEPFAAIMYDGEVNDLAMPYALTQTHRTALKQALPSLYFMHD